QGPGKLRIPLLSSVADAFANYSARIPRLCSPQIVAVHDLLSTVHLTDDEEDHDLYSWLGRDSNLIKFPTAETWDSLRLKAPAKAWSSSVWYKGATPKHAFNMWLAQLDRLPTRDRLISWGMPISPACCICSQFAESRDHLFLRCVFSEQIWKLILLRLNLSPCTFYTWSSLLVWTRLSSTTAPTVLRKLVAQAAIYHIWKQRNNLLHNQVSIPASTVFMTLEKEIRNTITARRNRRVFRNLMILWIR
ncbi:uncharacterized protein LOC110228436, partial [Arabidopsis lyrata subsp. lyrata]|uniref:uncharacterized protein LOC110228436 n=1 Tax=Arabidopsis lyrata subsp. lyrata TaxID=81972 RepID=UPI000A29CD1A